MLFRSTPKTWGSYYTVFQIGSYAAFSSKVQNASAIIASNAYASNNTDWNYLGSSVPSTRYETGLGEHRWFTAPAGTAGNAISFTQALTLTAGGNLLLGGTADPGGEKSVYVANTASVPGTPSGGGVLYVESGALKYKGSSGTVTTLGAA